MRKGHTEKTLCMQLQPTNLLQWKQYLDNLTLLIAEIEPNRAANMIKNCRKFHEHKHKLQIDTHIHSQLIAKFQLRDLNVKNVRRHGGL